MAVLTLLACWLLAWCIVVGVFAGLCLWLGARLFLLGRPLAEYDEPRTVPLAIRPGPDQAQVLARLAEYRRQVGVARRRFDLARVRAEVDALFGALAPAPAAAGIEIRPVDAGGVPAEWVLAPASAATRRLLYLHGGAFAVGSARSHRALTMALAARAGVAVLAIDYRLLPEHGRLAALEDSRAAYRWLLAHGPDGPAPATDVYVAGDSAGGCLVLALIAWLRDHGLRQVDAALAFAPATDATLESPSLRANAATDPFLGPSFGRLVRLPRWLLAWLGYAAARLPPAHPLVSPVRGSLARLPPTLIQASTSEMLRDDAQRWVNRARREGSPAELELWPEQIHVWQLFDTVSSDARAALASACAFLSRHRAPHGA